MLNNMKYIKTPVVLNAMLWHFRHSGVRDGGCYLSPSRDLRLPFFVVI